MGKWAKSKFGREHIGSLAIVLAGSATKAFEDDILSLFDSVVFSNVDGKHDYYLVEKNNVIYPVVFNIYGAPAMADVMTDLHDGGVTQVIFVGYAYGGFKNLDVGSPVFPIRSYHFDGLYSHIEPNRQFDEPDEEFKKLLERLFEDNSFKYHEGINVSVPAVSFQRAHNNPEYKAIAPSTCEMELTACLARAKDIGIRAVGILVISDNRTNNIRNKDVRYQGKKYTLELLINNLHRLSLDPLPNHSDYKISEYLAGIIYDPDDATNIYKEDH